MQWVIYHPTSDDAAALGQSWAIRIFKPLNSFTFTESTVDPNKIETILFTNHGEKVKTICWCLRNSKGNRRFPNFVNAKIGLLNPPTVQCTLVDLATKNA